MDVDHALSPEERRLFTPRDVRVGLLGNGRRSVSWTPPASERPVASYRVWSDSVQVAEVPGTQTSEIVTLDGARTHYIQVQAVDADGSESNRTEHWVIGRPTTDHIRRPVVAADRARRPSVNAPGWNWFPEQACYWWWDGERYTTSSVDAALPSPARAPTPRVGWRRVAVANGTGWFGLILGISSLRFLGFWWEEGRGLDLVVAMIGGGLSFVFGVVGLALAISVPRPAASLSSKIASVLAIVVSLLWGAALFLLIAGWSALVNNGIG